MNNRYILGLSLDSCELVVYDSVYYANFVRNTEFKANHLYKKTDKGWFNSKGKKMFSSSKEEKEFDRKIMSQYECIVFDKVYHKSFILSGQKYNAHASLLYAMICKECDMLLSTPDIQNIDYLLGDDFYYEYMMNSIDKKEITLTVAVPHTTH